MDEPSAVALLSYRPPEALAALAPLELPRIRSRLIDELGADVSETAHWRYASPSWEGGDAEVREALADPKIAPELADAVQQSLDGDRSTWEMLSGWTDESLTSWSVERFGTPTPDEMDAARQILATEGDGDRDEGGPAFDSTEVAERMSRALTSLELPEWSVEIVDGMAARASVAYLRKLVKVRAGARFAARDVDRLIAHEIGGHVLRAANAASQPTPFAQFGLGDTVTTDEGLAIWVEERLGVLRSVDRRLYAARLLAVELAATGGVLEVARGLREHLGPELAVDTAIRVKRGLRNPNRAGGLTKDLAYLRGHREVSKNLGHAHADPRILFATKWSLAHLPLVEQLVARGDLTLEHVRLPITESLFGS